MKRYSFLNPRILWPVALVALTLLITWMSTAPLRILPEPKKPTLDTMAIEMGIIREYGILLDSFQVTRGKIEPNQNLSSLLADQGLSDSLNHVVAQVAGEVFDHRKFRSGNNFVAFCEKTSPNNLQYLVYEISAIDYLVIDLKDSIRAYREQKEVKTITRTAGGEIHSSLWNAMIDAGCAPELAVSISEVFAWTIDFFGIQKGDGFKVIFDEQFVDSVSIGISKIHGAWFMHSGKEYFAFGMDQDTAYQFFDENGKSLKKAFLKAPLKFSRISSRFSRSRFHPVLKIFRPHYGVDYAAPVGTPVHSIGEGKVISATYAGGAGKMVKIKHAGGYISSYLHLSRFGPGITAGKRVAQGQVVGYVGSTGLSTGPHLDFRVFHNGNPINPLKVIAPPGKPVKQENMPVFSKIKSLLTKELNKIGTEKKKTLRDLLPF
jgi:murein DD-endopeptidase MepM/ murein hydrolase activator NlpD